MSGFLGFRDLIFAELTPDLSPKIESKECIVFNRRRSHTDPVFELDFG
jgi:hypothetical protein